MMGFSGNSKRPFLNSIGRPSGGKGKPLYEDRILYLKVDKYLIGPRQSTTSAVGELFKVSGWRAGAQSMQDAIEHLTQAVADAFEFGLQAAVKLAPQHLGDKPLDDVSALLRRR